jgi:ParB family transcriptional regulator, chromosome partitioning protein
MSDMDDMTDKAAKPQRRVPGLGRGLNALLGDVVREEPVAGAQANGGRSVQSIDISLIAPHPEQPRRHFDPDALAELAESISRRGVIQPIVVRPLGRGYQIVAGERRWRAAQRAQLHRIPALVRDFGDSETLEIALIENLQREELNPIEEAEAYRKLIAEYGHSQDALGRLVGKSRSHVANLMRLLDLPPQVQQMVVRSELSMGHARALIGAPDCEGLARKVMEDGLSVRETEKLASKAKPARGNGKASLARQTSSDDADLASLEQHLADLLGLHVEIRHKAGRGSLTLNYSNLDQLDMICLRLSGEGI